MIGQDSVVEGAGEVGRRFHGGCINWTEVGMVFVDLVPLVMERKPFVYEFEDECLM